MEGFMKKMEVPSYNKVFGNRENCCSIDIFSNLDNQKVDMTTDNFRYYYITFYQK